MKTVAFIGLGNMGGPMAINLVKAGFDVTVFDVFDVAMQAVCQHGANKANSAIDAVKGANFVISMLPSGSHVNDLYFGDNGIAPFIHENALVIDSSTIDVATAKAVALKLSERGIAFVDAPVSGGVAGAQAGTLTFIVGGEKQNVDAANPVLSHMGSQVFHAGPSGAGQIAKICNNMLLAIQMAGTAEALQLGIQHGLDAEVLSNIMLKSSGQNWTLERYNPCPNVLPNVPSSNGYQGGFMVKLMQKDLGLAVDTAKQTHSATPMGAIAQSLFDLHANQGNQDLDFSSIFNLYSPAGK